MEARPWHAHYDYEVPTTIRYPRIPLQEILNVPASACPNKAATIFFGTEMTYRELRSQVRRMANALAKLGVKKGDRVAIQLPNCPQYIIAYYGVMYLGAIVANVNPLYTVDEISNILKITNATIMITFSMILDTVHEACEKVGLSTVIVTAVTDYVKDMPQSTKAMLDLPDAWHHFSELIEPESDMGWPRVPIAPEDPALIMFTGGTTGVPKGAVHTHASVMAATLQFHVWQTTNSGNYSLEQRTSLAMMPFFHSAGNNVTLNPSIYGCATLILIPRFEIDEFMEALAGVPEIRQALLVPTIITAVLNHPRAAELDLGEKLKMLNSGAAPMPVELIEQVLDFGIKYAEGWGMTETASAGLANPLLGQMKTGSVGIPLPDIDYRIVDLEEGTHDMPAGEPGELIVAGPNIMHDYWENPEETANQLKASWLYTGDIAIRDEDYYVTIVGRKKDMIIAGGYNIYPREVDEVLVQHPKILQACAVGVPDAYRGETVKAFIVLRPGEAADEDEVVAHCKEHLAAYKVPKIVEFRESLPTSAIGKVLRKILRDEEEAKAADNGSPSE